MEDVFLGLWHGGSGLLVAYVLGTRQAFVDLCDLHVVGLVAGGVPCVLGDGELGDMRRLRRAGVLSLLVTAGDGCKGWGDRSAASPLLSCKLGKAAADVLAKAWVLGAWAVPT